MPRCLVSADDFAFNAAVDDGILWLIDAGLVTATSCLTRSPRWPAAARRLVAVRLLADIGVHVDLTEFESLAENHAALVAACYTHTIDARRLRGELRAQFDRFEDALGMPPDYVDGHRHVHQLPVVRDALIDLLTARYPQRLPWVRVSRDGTRSGWKGLMITGLGSERLAARCREAEVATNRRLLGFYDFTGNAAAYRARLTNWFEAAADDDALMCHPAARIEADDPIAPARLAEFEVMSSPWWSDYLESHQIRLCRGAEFVAR